MQGLIVKGIGGFYYVKTEQGIIEAKGRGIFKKDGIVLAVGDIVDIDIIDDEANKGVINAIFPRKNQFIRPPIANVDLFLVTFSAINPKPNFALVDKFLIMAEMHNVDTLICINKIDLVEKEIFSKYKEIYSSSYDVIGLSAKTGEGIEELKAKIASKKVAFAGPSGVGKSTLTNILIPHANTETGEISTKTSRGKHTTRHVEIFDAVDMGMVFDTPGFTSFDILEADEDSLMLYYPEIEKHRSGCFYDNCKHLKEPKCAVIDAVKNGEINKYRYESYVSNLNEIRSKKKY